MRVYATSYPEVRMTNNRVKWIIKVDNTERGIEHAPIGTVIAYAGNVAPNGWQWWFHPAYPPTRHEVTKWLDRRLATC